MPVQTTDASTESSTTDAPRLGLPAKGETVAIVESLGARFYHHPESDCPTTMTLSAAQADLLQYAACMTCRREFWERQP